MFVKRDASGKIVGLSDIRTMEFDEIADEQSDELLDFLKAENQDIKQTIDRLNTSDIELIRVLDDLIELLINKKIIKFTDLPNEAQEKLMMRQTLRQKKHNLDLLDDEDDSFKFL